MWPIKDIQNDPKNLKYLAARRKAFEACNLFVVLSFLFALGLSIVAFFMPEGKSSASDVLAVISLIYVIAETAYINPKIRKTSRRSAGLQEKFDCTLFDIEQNPNFALDASQASIEADATNLSNRKSSDLQNWYESDLGILPRPVAGLVAQYTSTAYDHSLRKFYLRVLWFLFLILVVCLVVFLVFQNEKFRDSIVVTIVPFVPLLTWFIATIRANSELASDQDKAMQLMDNAWVQVCRGVLKGPALKEAVRDSQDALYMRRAEGTLIFPGIYRFKRGELEGRAARSAATFRREYEAAFASAKVK